MSISFRSGPTARAKAQVRPMMNVTPLVDVVLVLLIIFMVVTPMMQHAARVDLPGILHVDPENKGRMDPVTLSLVRDGTAFYEQQPMALPDLEKLLAEIHRVTPERRVVLRGDREARYGDVRRLFALCRKLGFSGISLMVGEKAGARSAKQTGGGGAR